MAKQYSQKTQPHFYVPVLVCSREVMIKWCLQEHWKFDEIFVNDRSQEWAYYSAADALLTSYWFEVCEIELFNQKVSDWIGAGYIKWSDLKKVKHA